MPAVPNHCGYHGKKRRSAAKGDGDEKEEGARAELSAAGPRVQGGLRLPSLCLPSAEQRGRHTRQLYQPNEERVAVYSP